MPIHHVLALLLVSGHLAGLFSGDAFGAPQCQPVVAALSSVQGTVEVRRVGQSQWEQSRLNDWYCAGDRIQVGERSRADLVLANQPVLRLDQNTVLTLGAVKEERVSVLELVRGVIHFFSRAPRRLEVNTAFVNAGVRGTEGLIQVGDRNAKITVFEGDVLASNAKGEVRLGDGQSAVAEEGAAPVLRLEARPRDAVRWALYYPPVIYLREQDLSGGSAWHSALRNSHRAYLAGDYSAAFAALEEVSEQVRQPEVFAYRASLLLAVGRADEALPDIGRALSVNPRFAGALALKSVIAVVQGDKTEALSIAMQALESDASSSSALMAVSYAEQANFNLEGALSALQRAVQASPSNALAWARLAEIYLSLGRLNQALGCAQKAAELDPNLSRTQTVLGFAYLTRSNTRSAREAFNKAIERDQADSLPRLGLGLARIRDGDLVEGRKDVELAASLDPNHSLIRSYLGKAYFEEKRDELAERQYEIAEELDPKDPTPWFYDAIQKQTTNRPVAALADLQQAVERNDNRAVYRSRLLLDADQAARGASLGRIYSDLGFEQLALVEGWKSVNTDPASFSSHRLLADSYASLPRHEIARVSELLQSQLLQPLSLTPIQPRLGESNLFLISAGGPGAVSFNEFNQLFARDQLAIQASGLVGNDADGGEAVVSGIFDKYAFSLGGFRFDADGWRVNSDQRDTIANAFLQVQPTPGTGVQFEYRYRNAKTGDLDLGFFPEDFSAQLRNKIETQTFRFGLRYGLSPDSDVLGSFIYSRDRRAAHDQPDAITVLDIEEPRTRAFSGEIQSITRWSNFRLIAGAGYYKLDRNELTTVDLDFAPFGHLISLDDSDTSVTHTNIYLYSYLAALRSLTLALGASGDFFSAPNTNINTTTDPFSGTTVISPSTELQRSTNQFNPKLGLTWHPAQNTTLRTAVFRALKRSLITNQTLEPTQVAGFNQFYDDIEGTQSWHYGAAVDQKFSGTLFGGIAGSRRDLTVPITLTSGALTTVQTRDWREYLVRPYLYWTPRDQLALSVQYRYERFERSPDFLNFGLKTGTTRSVPMELRFFHPGGISVGVKTTYVRQEGDFTHSGSCCEAGESHFWVVDAGLSYRLPRRYGFVSVAIRNLFDEEFRYQETDFNNPVLRPGRSVFARLTLALP